MLDEEVKKAVAERRPGGTGSAGREEFQLRHIYLRLLFRDEQRKILGVILEEATNEARVLYRNFHDEHAHLIRFVTDLGVPFLGASGWRWISR